VGALVGMVSVVPDVGSGGRRRCLRCHHHCRCCRRRCRRCGSVSAHTRLRERLYPTAAATSGVRVPMPPGAARQQRAAGGRAREGTANRGGDLDGVVPGEGRGTPPLSPAVFFPSIRGQPFCVGVLRRPLRIRVCGRSVEASPMAAGA